MKGDIYIKKLIMSFALQLDLGSYQNQSYVGARNSTLRNTIMYYQFSAMMPSSSLISAPELSNMYLDL